MAGKKTPLYEAHRQAGAKIIDFGGWDMPVSYPAGTIKEHKAVREAVGLFDVSHMGEVYLRGPKARETVAKLTTNTCESAPPGKAVYAMSSSTFSACAVPAIRSTSRTRSLTRPDRTAGRANPRSEHLANVVIM